MTTRSEKRSDIKGDAAFPRVWTVFAPLEPDAPVPSRDMLSTVPELLVVRDKTLKPITVEHSRNQYELREFIGEPFSADVLRKLAYVFLEVDAPKAGDVTIGLGGDCWVSAWVNGDLVLEEVEDSKWPPAITNQVLDVPLRKGINTLVVRLRSGLGSSLLAVGGPRELRQGDVRSICSDPLVYDARWTAADTTAIPAGKKAVEIGSRRELFIDDFMIDAMSGGVTRRMHHPQPREIVFRADRPWEGPITGYYTTIQEDDHVRLYYSGRPDYRITPDGRHIHDRQGGDESRNQVTCLAQSPDGISFTRPDLGLFEIENSTQNNLIWKGTPSHNFSPFKDTNPDAADDARYKAIAYHVDGGGLGAFASPDGIRWRPFTERRIITSKVSGFDSHNLAFWDPLRHRYVAFCRLNTGGLRRIATCESEDFIHWTELALIEFEDDRQEHMYTNNIRPYPRAPHIYVGMPARHVPRRKKVPAHPATGVADAALITSRDGHRFHRWETGFVRPGFDPQVWTDRNNYPAWAMLQLTPEEISVYWNEHSRHPTTRLRRGVIRTDGFVSVHADGSQVGDMVTRPFVFSGEALELNYATSAIGTVRCEICDQHGEALPGLSLEDSEVLYGNEIAHDVVWFGGHSPGDYAGQTVRLRVRLHDADLYAFRFHAQA